MGHVAPPLPPTRATLFHAIVATGVALTACGGEATNPPAVPTGDRDAATPPDAGSDAGAADARPDGGCPAGSELPVPPCYLIR